MLAQPQARDLIPAFGAEVVGVDPGTWLDDDTIRFLREVFDDRGLLLFLLVESSRRDWLMEDPEGRIDQTVEEIVRLTSAHNLGLMRYAVEDVELGGVTIRKGDLVIISEGAANRDPEVFENPEAFDPTRNAKGHLAFGHGMHVCIGQSLARAELSIVFPSLFRRFPGLRLAVDPSELRIRSDRTGGGVDHLHVTW